MEGGSVFTSLRLKVYDISRFTTCQKVWKNILQRPSGNIFLLLCKEKEIALLLGNNCYERFT